MPQTFDVIVLGVGGVGSAACFELARRGRRVLGLEQFDLAHSRGSSHGHTRIIRQAYHEHPDYVPLVRRAYSRWYDLEQRTGRHLLTECACLNVGPAAGPTVMGARASARKHGLQVLELAADKIMKTFPQFRFPEGYAGVLEASAGFLFVEACVRAHVDAAISLGAEIHENEPVLEWKAVGDGVEVRTAKETYHAARLVVTAGAWATKLLADLGVPLTVMRQVLLWFGVTGREHLFRRDSFPIFIAETPDGYFYGLPAIDSYGLKVAAHQNAPRLPGPDGVDWAGSAADEPPVRSFLEQYIPSAAGTVTKTQVCMYTMTPDGHFVIDRHPHYPQVSVACGFSGHGFKFASAVGEVLADLADHGRTGCRIELFSALRFRK